MIEFKPCPFCESYNLFLDEDYHTVFMYCVDCGAKGPPSLGDDIDPPTKAWNTRVDKTDEPT